MTRVLTLTGNVVDVPGRRIVPAELAVAGGRIRSITPVAAAERFILPGFIDAHVHVESSMMVPGEFARYAVGHGTVATVSDPHEIANVLGLAGVRLMVEAGRRTPFHFHWGVPSCVPATAFETAGDRLGPDAVRELFEQDGLGYLSEMMNYPGVLHGDPEVLEKIAIARQLGRPVDGHAPGLRGDDAQRYAAAGITTDHECVTLDEALDKIAADMIILIREGSAAKNFAALSPLLQSHPGRVMLCTDDLHPDALVAGHIDRLVARAVAGGADVFDVLTAACIRPAEHYGLGVGRLRVGDPADFIVVDDLEGFNVRATYLAGEKVAEDGVGLLPRYDCPVLSRFHATPVAPSDFRVPAGGDHLRVIGARDGQLVTDELIRPAVVSDGVIVADPSTDLLKIAVVNRYQPAPPAVAFIRGFGLMRGAIAASVAHDSHNVVAVGVTDEELARAVNAVIAHRGGLAVAAGDGVDAMPLEVAGLMGRDGDAVAAGYARLDAAAKALGSELAAPFMTLSFMALLVIPALKLSDRGLFDGRRFKLVDVFEVQDTLSQRGPPAIRPV
jgi:adenine deaminase